MRSLLFFVFSILILLGCSSQPKQDVTETVSVINDSIKHDGFERGVILSNVKCVSDSSLSYALYLPKVYKGDKKTPVIYFFDPHASGSLPLEKYKELAEKYGYILAGSNNSKNGMSWEQNAPQVRAFMQDVKARLNTDEQRIYTSGFSGGSRVASSVAIFAGGINTVIGMGGGFPSITEPIKNHFDYFGFAGNEDFNMGEMVSLNTSMDKVAMRHQLVIFDGKHEWAPAPEVEEAFIWLEFNAMKAGLVLPNDSLVIFFINKCEKEASQLTEKKLFYEEYQLRKKMINFLDGITEVELLKQKLDKLAGSAEFKRTVEKKGALAQEEMNLQQSYRNALTQENIGWWNAEVAKLNSKTKSADKEIASKYKRLMSYLSLAVYMNAGAALSAGQLENTEKFLKIYELVDPKNPEHQVLFAGLAVLKKDNEKALSYLNRAVKLGFKDLRRAETDASLAPLRGTPEFQSVLVQMRAAQ